MIDLTPERRADLRELAERVHPFVRHGGTDPAAVYVPAADLLTLLNAADERDRLAAVVERVRALHKPVAVYEVCPTCHDKAGVHPCGGCRECHQVNGYHKLDCGRRS